MAPQQSRTQPTGWWQREGGKAQDQSLSALLGRAASAIWTVRPEERKRPDTSTALSRRLIPVYVGLNNGVYPPAPGSPGTGPTAVPRII